MNFSLLETGYWHDCIQDYDTKINSSVFRFDLLMLGKRSLLGFEWWLGVNRIDFLFFRVYERGL